MTKWCLTFGLLLLGTLSATCGSDDEPVSSNDRYLIRPITCTQNDIDELVNCEPTLALCEDGRAFVFVTMNVSEGTFTENEENVVITVSRGTDASPIGLVLDEDNQEAEDDVWGETWTFTDTPKFFLCAVQNTDNEEP